ncbi:hypothetical protein ADUPG1_009698 [Aduncisulcus paluster]|uniref:Band 7 domain-containing protein n=1 Tax=Aduncisulcus paluster TaxID=2918883 RepID=A0ABQ5KWG4_9EUKA|nr:hypothetical protein ADUPG1_009698 [Aduncisulcus paluster]
MCLGSIRCCCPDCKLYCCEFAIVGVAALIIILGALFWLMFMKPVYPGYTGVVLGRISKKVKDIQPPGKHFRFMRKIVSFPTYDIYLDESDIVTYPGEDSKTLIDVTYRFSVVAEDIEAFYNKFKTWEKYETTVRQQFKGIITEVSSGFSSYSYFYTNREDVRDTFNTKLAEACETDLFCTYIDTYVTNLTFKDSLETKIIENATTGKRSEISNIEGQISAKDGEIAASQSEGDKAVNEKISAAKATFADEISQAQSNQQVSIANRNKDFIKKVYDYFLEEVQVGTDPTDAEKAEARNITIQFFDNILYDDEFYGRKILKDFKMTPDGYYNA